MTKKNLRYVWLEACSFLIDTQSYLHTQKKNNFHFTTAVNIWLQQSNIWLVQTNYFFIQPIWLQQSNELTTPVKSKNYNWLHRSIFVPTGQYLSPPVNICPPHSNMVPVKLKFDLTAAVNLFDRIRQIFYCGSQIIDCGSQINCPCEQNWSWN